MENKMKVVAIVQARMSSTRLPGKVLSELCGTTMLGVLLHRVGTTPGIDEVVVATTTNPADDVLVAWLEGEKIPCFRGDESDVLDRFWRCANEKNAEVIVRITADDPLKDPSVTGKAIAEFLSRPGIDYVSNTLKPTYPEGLDIEVFSLSALARAHEAAVLPSEREHVTPYIYKNPDKFSVFCFEMQPDLSDWRWTVDKPEDLLFVKKVFGYFDNDIDVGYERIIDLIREKPELAEINAGTIRNEGYIESIQKEQDK